MPDIAARVISPDQVRPEGEAGAFPLDLYGKRLLAQGDSWFSLGAMPFWDTTSIVLEMQFAQSAVIVNCAHPGRVLSHMADNAGEAKFLRLLRGRSAMKWDAVLLSGGGNDLIDAMTVGPQAPAGQRLLLKPDEWKPAGDGPARYISDEGWALFCTHLRAVFLQMVVERDKGPNADKPLLCHTYDLCCPRDAPAAPHVGPWLVGAVRAFGIPQAEWPAVARELLQSLRTLLQDIVAGLTQRHVHLVDTQGTLVMAAPTDTGPTLHWQNEIHPSPAGYRLLAQRWRPVLEALW